MINLKVRTEYSFRTAYGSVEKIIQNCEQESIGITDFGGTWGHVPFNKHCSKAGKKPIFGVEAGIINGWEKYLDTKNFIGMSTFGESGPYKELYNHFKITDENLVELIRKTL